MKTKFTLLAILLVAFSFTRAQQVPNNDFETWTSPNNPDGWSTYESLFNQPLGLVTKDTADKIINTASVKIVSAVVPVNGLTAGVLDVGSAHLSGPLPVFDGMPFAYRPDTLLIVFKYATPGPDTPVVSVTLSKLTTPILDVQGYLPASAAWAAVQFPITTYYVDASTPDTLKMSFSPSHVKPVAGSTLKLDGILMQYKNLPTALVEVANKLNVSVYPNPASEMITISSEMNVDGYSVYVMDLNGKVVAGKLLQGTKNTIAVSSLASGTYIYRLADKQGNVLKSDRFNVVK